MQKQTYETRKPLMSAYRAVAIAEGFWNEPVTEEEVIEAWQFLINTGMVWTLQGWFGRQARDLIAAGICHE